VQIKDSVKNTDFHLFSEVALAVVEEKALLEIIVRAVTY
jgi:hypothetical protein